MAKATIKTAPVEPVIPVVESITLELTLDDAKWLAGILVRVQGDDPIYSALNTALTDAYIDWDVATNNIDPYKP